MHDRNEPDHSGVTLYHTEEPQPKTAAVMLLVTGGLLPPKATGECLGVPMARTTYWSLMWPTYGGESSPANHRQPKYLRPIGPLYVYAL